MPPTFSKPLNDLPPSVADSVEGYDNEVGHRDRFLWKWLNTVFENIQHTSVPEHLHPAAHAQKTRLGVFLTTIDDFIDIDQNPKLFAAANTIPQKHTTPPTTLTDDEQCRYEFVKTLWDDLISNLKHAPNYDEFHTVFRHDLRRGFEASKYTAVVSENPSLGSYEETIEHESQTMFLHALTDIDLMYSPNIDPDEIGEIRNAVAYMEPMARIGNWVTTWERELEEGDCTSGIFMKAKDEGIVTVDELRRLHRDDDDDLREDIRKRIQEAGIEDLLMDDWLLRYQKAEAINWDVDSVDLDAYQEGIETLFEYHLASKGMK